MVRYVEAPLADVLNVAASGHDVTELLEDSVATSIMVRRQVFALPPVIKNRITHTAPTVRYEHLQYA